MRADWHLRKRLHMVGSVSRWWEKWKEFWRGARVDVEWGECAGMLGGVGASSFRNEYLLLIGIADEGVSSTAFAIRGGRCWNGRNVVAGCAKECGDGECGGIGEGEEGAGDGVGAVWRGRWGYEVAGRRGGDGDGGDDSATEGELAESIKQLEGLPVTFKLGGHVLEDFLGADLLVLNPAVDKEKSEVVREALGRGVPYTTEMNLFVER